MTMRSTATLKKGHPMSARESAGPGRHTVTRRIAGAAASLLVLALGACATDTTVTSSTLPADYRLRHPIGLVNSPADLDVFVGQNTGFVDERQREDIRTFAKNYRQDGRGPLLMMVPAAHSGMPVASHRGVQTLKALLASGGVPGSMIQVTSYAAPGDPIAAPVRLTFAKLQAKVMTKCGEWPADVMGNVASVDGWHNRNYHNFGCAMQTVYANQVADPLDLIRPRDETRADINRRMKVFDDARKSTDPSTGWKTGTASVAGGG